MSYLHIGRQQRSRDLNSQPQSLTSCQVGLDAKPWGFGPDGALEEFAQRLLLLGSERCHAPFAPGPRFYRQAPGLREEIENPWEEPWVGVLL